MIDWDKVVNGPVMGVFGEPATFQPAVGAPFTIHGTFHEAYTSVVVADEMAVSTTGPAIGVRLSEFPAPPKQKDRVVITATSLHGGGTYVVKEMRPNGIGGALLLLNYVGP
jgi:hypothetical protein